MAEATADLCDLEDTNGCVHMRTVHLHDYGKRVRFSGHVVTVRCFEDNSLLSKVLDESGKGKVLVVDGAGSTARALFGDQMAAKVRICWNLGSNC